MKRLWMTSCALALWAMTAAWAQDGTTPAEAVGGEEAHQRLDARSEALLTEVLELGAEMAVLDEQRHKPEMTQLLVLVSLPPMKGFQLDAVQLQLDGRPAAQHRYSAGELRALAQGGAQRLYWDSVRAGRHELTATVIGKHPVEPKYQRQASLTFISGAGRRVMEVGLAPGAKQAAPVMSLQEWK
jgi:hypothetical protein